MAEEFGEIAPGAGEGVPRRRGRGIGRRTTVEQQACDPTGQREADEHDPRRNGMCPRRRGVHFSIAPQHAIAAQHDRAIGEPVTPCHPRERGGQRHHGEEPIGVREPGRGHRLGNRADHARREQRRLTADHDHGRQQQPEPGGQTGERSSRPHAPGHGGGRGGRDEDLRELAPDNHRPLRIPVGDPAGQPCQQHERQHEARGADREHERHLAPGDRLLSEADRQPAEHVVVDDRERPEGQQRPKATGGGGRDRFQVSPQFMR